MSGGYRLPLQVFEKFPRYLVPEFPTIIFHLMFQHHIVLGKTFFVRSRIPQAARPHWSADRGCDYFLSRYDLRHRLLDALIVMASENLRSWSWS